MGNRRIVIRADSSIQIGSGHVMRCLALAQQLRIDGADVAFVSRDLPGNLNAQIMQQGFTLYSLPTPDHGQVDIRDNYLGSQDVSNLGWQVDAEQTRELLAEIYPDWLVVDHYALDRRWETSVRPYAGHLMVVDDLANRRHDCDLLLDQNPHDDAESSYTGLVPDNCDLLLGPTYALLRSEFRAERNRHRIRRGPVRRILISFGGTDTANETEKAIAAVANLAAAGVTVDVVVGNGNPRRRDIMKLCEGMPGVQFGCQVDNMAEIMAQADLGIGAGGSTALERCCAGLPSIVVILADNQRRSARQSALLGVARCLGEAKDVSIGDYQMAIASLSAEALLQMRERAMQLVDGNGCQRVASRMLGEGNYIPPVGLSFRVANEGDAASILEWRNSPEVRAYSLDSHEISWSEHLAWFNATLVDPNRRLLVVEEKKNPVGVVRFDMDDCGRADISIFLAPERMGKGLGTEALRCAVEWARTNLISATSIRAKILPGNVASIKAFRKAGFTERFCVYEIKLAD